MTDLPAKYRPERLSQVVGHGAVIRALSGPEIAHMPALLFHGPSGVGKTTLARIAALTIFGADVNAVVEVNAADKTGVEEWRKLSAELAYAPMYGSVTVVIVDECQALSAASWKVLLKPIEEPPSHVRWVFCTTELRKVPVNIQTRCVSYALGALSAEDLEGLVARVVGSEEIWGFEDRNAAIWHVVEYAAGSPRQALVGLATARGCGSADEVREVLTRPRPEPEVIEFCKLVVRAPTWAQLRAAVRKLPKGTDPESVRRVLVGYVTAVVLSEKTKESALPRLMAVLDAFQQPYADRTNVAPLVLSLGRLWVGG